MKKEHILSVIGVILSIIGIFITYYLGVISNRLSEASLKFDEASLYMNVAQNNFEVEYENEDGYNFGLSDLPEYAVAEIKTISGFLTKELSVSKNGKSYYKDDYIISQLMYTKEDVPIDVNSSSKTKDKVKYYNNKCSFTELLYNNGTEAAGNYEKYKFDMVEESMSKEGYKIDREDNEAIAYIEIVYDIDYMRKYQYCKLHYDNNEDIVWLENIDRKEYHEKKDECIACIEKLFDDIGNIFKPVTYFF